MFWIFAGCAVLRLRASVADTATLPIWRGVAQSVGKHVREGPRVAGLGAKIENDTALWISSGLRRSPASRIGRRHGDPPHLARSRPKCETRGLGGVLKMPERILVLAADQ
jgi:hypothetical protein